MRVDLDQRQRLVIETPWDYAPVCQRIPDRKAWDGKARRWVATPSRVTVEFLRRELPGLAWSKGAKALADRLVAAASPAAKADVADFEFTGAKPAWAHQREAFARFRHAEVGALLMEQRTGKTRPDIHDSVDAFLRSLIDLHIVICPNNVKSVWVDEEIPAYVPKSVPYEAILYESIKRKDATARVKAWRGGQLQFLVVNCECLSTSTGYDWLASLIAGRKVKVTVDEATRFKSPTSARSKNLLKLRKLPAVVRRRIATGTLITQGPLDAYVPFAFLDPAILGYSSFYSFRNDFAVLGGYMGKQVVGYVNEQRLADLIAPFSFRVTRDQCFDIPPKVYGKAVVELTEKQRELYDSMRDMMIAEFEDKDGDVEVPILDEWGEIVGFRRVRQITATIVLTKMLRLAQITGGFFTGPEGVAVPIPGGNPKMDALLDGIEETRGKSIVWARFRPEIALIAAELRKRYGPAAVTEFHGGIKSGQRTLNRQAFQNPASPVKILVGQAQAGGIGIPLHLASDVFYFSNSFSLEDRLQSEDRAQNLEKRHSVGYFDIVAKATLDLKVLAALREKKKLADVINKDNVKEWI